MPLSACGLRLPDEAKRVAVGLHLGTIHLSSPSLLLWLSSRPTIGTHAFSCKQNPCRTLPYHNFNDLIRRASLMLIFMLMIKYLILRTLQLRTYAHYNCQNSNYSRLLSKAGVPSLKEPHGHTRFDGKRPDGLTLIPWREDRSAIWGVTVTSTIAASYPRLLQPPPQKQLLNVRRQSTRKSPKHIFSSGP
jgi:hypothetical protein